MSDNLQEELERADALESGGPTLSLEEIQQLEAREDIEGAEGAYILRLVSGAVASLPERISLVATARTVELECVGGAPLPPELFCHPAHELLQAPLRRRIRQLMLGTQQALRQGAAEVEVACGQQRAFLTPRGCSTADGSRPASGWLMRISWPGRSRCPEPHHIYDRFALSPVPIKVNGSLVNPPLDVGQCAIALELAGPIPVMVDSEPLVLISARLEEFWGWMGLGGDWSWQERPRSRVYFVVDGLSYTLDEMDLGCWDLRAVIHAPNLQATPDAEYLDREHPGLANTLTLLARQVERCKQELARSFPGPDPRPYGAATQELLHLILREMRARAELAPALDLAQRLGDVPEVAAGMAARLGQYPLARDLLLDSDGHPDSLETVAMVLLECGEPVRAEHTLLDAERLRRQDEAWSAGESPELAPGQDPVRLAATLGRLSAICSAQGRYAEADRHASAASALASESLEEDHPAIPRSLLVRTRAYLYQDRLIEAARMAAIAADLLAKDPLGLAQARVHQALVAYVAGDLEAADDRAGEAAARLRLRWGADHPELAACLFLRGLIVKRQGQPGKAGVLLSQALSVLTATLGELHPDTAAVHLALASVRQAQKDHPRGLEHARQARDGYRHSWGLGHPAVARALDCSSRLQLARGAAQAAEEEAREAVRILGYHLRQAEVLDSFPDSLGTAAYRWWDQADGMDVRPLLGIPPARLGRECQALLSALLQLARVLRVSGKDGEANVCLARAREIRMCRGTAALALAPEGPMRRSQQGFTVLLRLQAPGRVLHSLYLDTAPRAVKLSSEGKVRVDEGVMVLLEPERKLVRADSPLLSQPWGPTPVSFLLHAADPTTDGIRGKPRVITVMFREGPCLRLPVRL